MSASRLAAFVLVAAGVGATFAGAVRPAPARRASEAFQALVHGLGLGPSVDLSDPTPAFDPRLGATRGDRLVPFLAGSSLGRRAGRTQTPP